MCNYWLRPHSWLDGFLKGAILALRWLHLYLSVSRFEEFAASSINFTTLVIGVAVQEWGGGWGSGGACRLATLSPTIYPLITWGCLQPYNTAVWARNLKWELHNENTRQHFGALDNQSSWLFGLLYNECWAFWWYLMVTRKYESIGGCY